MSKSFSSIFIAASLVVGLTMFSVDASGPEYKSDTLLEEPGASPLWQHLFVERKTMEKFPVALIGQSVDIKEPFATQIQRTLQVLTTRRNYWTPGKGEPHDESVLFSASFRCGVTRQHWPVNTFFDDSCGKAQVTSDWLSDSGVVLLTEILNHYWNRSPQVHYMLLNSATWDRTEDKQELKTEIRIKAEYKFTFGDLRKLSAYFFSHRIITERKLKEFPKLKKQLESYYVYGDVPITLAD